jgi:hypothetical protein
VYTISLNSWQIPVAVCVNNNSNSPFEAYYPLQKLCVRCLYKWRSCMTAAINVVPQRLITKVKYLVLCTRWNVSQCSIDEQRRRTSSITLWVIKSVSQRQIFVVSWQACLPACRYSLLLTDLITVRYYNRYRWAVEYHSNFTHVMTKKFHLLKSLSISLKKLKLSL